MREFDEETRREIRDNAATARDAASEVARQMSVLWEARLNMAMAAGDAEGVSAAMKDLTTTRYMDNCNCGGGGGGTAYYE